MYLTIDEILSSVFRMPLQSVNGSPKTHAAGRALDHLHGGIDQAGSARSL
jgi:hypothetical protein